MSTKPTSTSTERWHRSQFQVYGAVRNGPGYESTI